MNRSPQHVAALVLLSLFVARAGAIPLVPFQDVKTFAEKAKEVVLADCLNTDAMPGPKVDDLTSVEADIVKVLKGERKPGKARLTTIGQKMEKGRRYMMLSFGGSALGSDFLANADLAVVEVPGGFDLKSLDGKSLPQQMQLVFDARREQLSRLLSQLELEKSALARTDPEAGSDEIDRLAKKLRATSGLWSNGIMQPIMLPADAKPEQVVAEAVQRAPSDGTTTRHRLVKHRVVESLGPPVERVSAALVETDAGSKILLFFYRDARLGWWVRFYDPDPVTSAAADLWSKPTHGLQARITLVEKEQVNGTRCIMPYLELRNTSESSAPLQVRLGRDGGGEVKFELVDADGKAIRDGWSLPRSGKQPDPGTVSLPFDSSMRIGMYCGNWGVPRNAAAMIAADSGAWVIEPQEKGKVFVRATIKGQKVEPGAQQVWEGVIETPPVRVIWAD